MVDIGKKQKLKVIKITPKWIYLEENIYLPNILDLDNIKEDSEIEVFVYRDSKNNLIASTKEALAQVGDLAYLKVIDITNIGAFLDIGLEKDLFLPFKEQRYNLVEDESYLVAVYLDKSGRLCATTDIYEYLKEDSSYKKGDWVKGTVYMIDKEIGAFIAVDNKYKGLIPKNEYFQEINNGEIIEARVIRVREDGKLDLSPRKIAYQQMESDADLILDIMKKNDGFLNLNDKSEPLEIKKQLDLSKSSFKRAVGKLLKENKIAKKENGIVLKNN